MKKNNINLLEGNIGISLLKLAVPVILTSLMSILLSLSDTKFIAYFLGDKSVNAASAAIFYIGLGFSIVVIPRIGSQVLISQMIGANNEKLARRYARAGIQIAFLFGLIYSLLCIIFPEQLVKFVGISERVYVDNAVIFLRANAISFIFLFINATLSSQLMADGDSMGPFIVNSSSILINIFLDYLFMGVFHFGIAGAGIATSISVVCGTIFMIVYIRKNSRRYDNIKLFKINKYITYKKVIKLGLPVGIGNILMTLVAIQIANEIATINEAVIGVQRLGIQFEAFSWNIALGVSSALATFVGQNYGAKNFARLKQGIIQAAISMSIFGILITLVFVNFGENMYRSFLTDPKLISEGIKYIKIIGLSQMFQAVDILVSAGYNGVGQTKIPLFIGVFFKIIRIPLISIFAPIFGLSGIWWIISATTITQAIFTCTIFIFYFKFLKKGSNESSIRK